MMNLTHFVRIKNCTGSQAYKNKIDALNELKRYDESLKCYDQWIKNCPTESQAFYKKSNLYNYELLILTLFILERYEEAFNQQIIKQPEYFYYFQIQYEHLNILVLKYIKKIWVTMKCCDQWIQQIPSDSQVCKSKIKTLQEIDKLTRHSTQIKKYLDCNDIWIKNCPNESEPYQNKCDIYELGIEKEAIQCQ